MKEPIRFKISYDKATEAIVWLAHMKPQLDIYRVAKVLFFADKMHINKYARPIIGDTYIKMPRGPVPSAVRDLIVENPWLSPKQLEKIKNSLTIGSRAEYYQLTAKRKPDWDFFSKSDLACLTASLDKYGNLSFEKLFNLSHDEKCYYSTAPNAAIDYALFVDDSNSLRDSIIKDMQATSMYVQV